MTGVAMAIMGGGGGAGSPLMVVAAPNTLSWVFSDPVYVSSDTSTATVSGGSGSYGYQWMAGPDTTAVSPTSATTLFFSGTGAFATFFCVVTDLVTGATGTSNNVTVS